MFDMKVVLIYEAGVTFVWYYEKINVIGYSESTLILDELKKLYAEE